MNFTVSEIANMVKEVVGEDVKLVTTPTNDNRSYHISSDKIFNKLGFRANRSIKLAAEDLKKAFDSGLLPNSLTDEKYFNIKRMQSISLR
ncbi:hypothetical protein LEP1GSC124_5484 [Leptospira interrogans serovar Pyrogenes str. 200701872]|uniref:Uncharacterized protein n=1 Tax=Leptospira interrogans serovar Pyrogenes str. 200701872 TaxID=1193029 RepID=M6ZMJ3_LEPIR|nr:hypothetical protein LEP1GSC124_5484 [Leptospira interrogans serovar Pyrogenes str. 200701872]